MPKVRFPFQRIMFNKRGSDVLEFVDWEEWSLKKQRNNLHELSFKITYPDNWIDFDSETGLRLNIGDEVGLWASWGTEYDDSSKRFGGYITGIQNSYSGDVSLSVTCKDYKISLANKQVFKDYYKMLPLKVGQYADRIGHLYTRNVLHDNIVDLCAIAGFSDFSQLPVIYKWSNNNGTPFTRTVGANSTSTKDTTMKSTTNPSVKMVMSASDTENVFTMYDDASGYPLHSFPHIPFVYHHPKNCLCEWGLRVTINGTLYYIPFMGTLSEYVGVNMLKAIPKAYTTTFTSMNIPLGDMMDELYPAIDQTVTKLELVAKRAAGLKAGTFWIMQVGAVNANNYLPISHSYSYKTALELINEMCAQTKTYFDINPFKQPIYWNMQDKITDKFIMEGYNLITADTSYDDDELVNNQIVLSNVEDTKAYIGHSVDWDSIDRHGEYNKVEENSDYKDKTAIQLGAFNLVSDYSYLTPSLKVTILPDFDFVEGDVIYVYIPSLGIEKTLQILTITWSYDGKMDLELGNPEPSLEKLLKQLNAKQNLGLSRGTQSLDGLSVVNREQKFADQYIRPQGQIKFTGDDLVESGVNINSDTGRNGELYWITSNLQGQITIDDNGVKMGQPVITDPIPNIASYTQSTNEDMLDSVAFFRTGCNESWSDEWASHGTISHKFVCTATTPSVYTHNYPSSGYSISAGQYINARLKTKFSKDFPQGCPLYFTVNFYTAANALISSVGTTYTHRIDSRTFEIVLTDTVAPANTHHCVIFFKIDNGWVVADDYFYVDSFQVHITASAINQFSFPEFEPGGGRVMFPLGIPLNHQYFKSIKDVWVTLKPSTTAGTPSYILNMNWLADFNKDTYPKDALFRSKIYGNVADIGSGLQLHAYVNQSDGTYFENHVSAQSDGSYKIKVIKEGTNIPPLDFYHLVTSLQIGTGNYTYTISQIEINYYAK